METRERLISADDHVDLAHDTIKGFLASKFHDDYDRALGKFAASMGAMMSSAANQRWREQQGMEADPSVEGAMGRDRAHPAWGRAGHTDAHERLKDMDTDGVEASSTYCEVSAFRYLYMLERGSAEATRAIAPQTGTVAVVYEYNCGATTDFATHVSILKPGATPLGPGNVFVADTDHGRAEAAPWGGPWAALRWTGPEALELSYDASARVFSSDPKVAGVTITFLPVAR